MPGEFRLARWSEDPSYIEDYYDLEVNIRSVDRPGREYIWIGETPLPGQVEQHFSSAEFLVNLSTQVYPSMTHEVYLYSLRGFRPDP